MYVAIFALVAVWCIAARSLVPALFVGLPSFYGAWLVLLFGTTQHAGLREDVLDHRLNTRTVYMNPLSRFLYLNMNYHVEHHLFPTVPYHALPQLHEEVKDQLVKPTPSIIAAYREIVPALLNQRKDPTWELDRQLPSVANSAAAEQTKAFVGETSVKLDGVKVQDGADGSNWIEVNLDSPLEIDDVFRVDFGDMTYAVYRTSAGVFATDGICTHSRRVHLADGVVIGDEIECPKHNGRFNIETGSPVRAPVCVALNTYAVRGSSGSIQIAMP